MIENNFFVIGSGNWGITFSKILADNTENKKIYIYTIDLDINKANKLNTNYKLYPELKLGNNVVFVNNFEKISDCKNIVFAVPSEVIVTVCNNLKTHINKNHFIINLTKGFDNENFLFMFEIIKKYLNLSDENISVISGPNIAKEIAKKIPTLSVIASKNIDYINRVQKLITNNYFRLYKSDDIYGVSIGGTVKNIIAIGAGIIDGLKLGQNTKSAYITRGLTEIIRLSEKFNCKKETLYGLSGLGDLIVTCESEFSRNRTFGEKIALSNKDIIQSIKDINETVEGYHTCKSIYNFSKKNDIYMPITEQIYSILYENKPINTAINELMTRSEAKFEYF